MKDVKISSVQLSFLTMGFLFGSTAIISPASSARQDSWLAFILGWAGGFILVGMYSCISLLNPSKTLIEILKEHFGKILGSIFSLLYIWYFLHLASLILRNFGEYMITVNYPETPMSFIILCLSSIVAYAAKKGLEVIARTGEMLVPVLPILVIFTFFALIKSFQLDNFFPVLERGITPVLEKAFGVLSFPFGEMVVFLMVFPFLNKKKNLLRTSFISVFLIGTLILSIITRDLMVLGPEMVAQVVFPPEISTKLIPGVDIDPVVAINFLIGGGIKTIICIYAAAMGITQLFALEDYKILVLPLMSITIALSIWLYESLFEMLDWASNVWPYYSIPFQIVLPVLLLIISWFKRKKTEKAAAE